MIVSDHPNARGEHSRKPLRAKAFNTLYPVFAFATATYIASYFIQMPFDGLALEVRQLLDWILMRILTLASPFLELLR